VLTYLDRLPRVLAQHPLVREQRALALGKLRAPTEAAAELQSLIDFEGPTPERWGLLGGRYKELYRAAGADADRRRYLDRAIDAYEHGMLLDLNGYYSSSNLPRLYRARNGDGDAERAAEAGAITLRACNRAIQLGIADEWTRPTLLGCAFSSGDAADARRVADEVEREGADAWKLDTTLLDLEADVRSQPDAGVQAELEEVLARLTALLPAQNVGAR
jgi:hypothetical protein